MPAIALFSHPIEKPFAVFVESQKTDAIPDFKILTEDGHRIQTFIELDTDDYGIQGVIALMRLENASGANGIHMLLTAILREAQQKTR